MSALNFIEDLFNSGNARVPAALDAPGDIDTAVRELDRRARLHLAGEAPALQTDAGAWALLTLFRACQALAYREIGEEAIADALSRPCPSAPSPTVCYSVDLAFSFLPELIRLARGVAEDDPLVLGLMQLAKAWPLSSVGVAGIDSPSIDGFIHHPTLRQLYVDRIIDRSDVQRLNNELTREAVREALGEFSDLAPRLADALRGET